jgi:hypothetical protein
VKTENNGAKKHSKGVVVSIDNIDKYLQSSRADFQKNKEAQKERERKTMERSMNYWINT